MLDEDLKEIEVIAEEVWTQCSPNLTQAFIRFRRRLREEGWDFDEGQFFAKDDDELVISEWSFVRKQKHIDK